MRILKRKMEGVDWVSHFLSSVIRRYLVACCGEWSSWKRTEYLDYPNLPHFKAKSNQFCASNNSSSSTSSNNSNSNNNNNNYYYYYYYYLLTAFGLSPGGSGYFTCTYTKYEAGY